MELSEDRLSPPEDRNMNRKTITNICTIPAALFLVLIGIVHSMVNFSGLRRAAARGGEAAGPGGRVAFYLVVSWLFFNLFWLAGRLFFPGPRAGGPPARPAAGSAGL